MVMAISSRRAARRSFPDRELIVRTRAGDDEAYAELYNRHVKAARATAWCLTHSEADTDDAVSEAFMQILATLRRGLGPEEAFRPYLLTCVRNACSSRGRRARTITVDPTDLEAAAEPTPPHDADHWTEVQLVGQAF